MTAKRVVAKLLDEEINSRLAQVCAERLKQMGTFEQANLLRHCENMAELHSYLRDRVFHKDSATTDFIRQCLAELEPARTSAV